jgi:hypothetical protein
MSRRFQFSLRALLLVVTMAAVVAWTIKRTGPVILFGVLVCYAPVWLFLALRGMRSFAASREETD